MKEKILGVVFILVLGGLSAGLLSSVDNRLRGKIAENKEVAIKSSIMAAAGLEVPQGVEEVKNAFTENIVVKKAGEYSYYTGPGGIYLFEMKGPGLWGSIEGVLALMPDLETIKSVKIISQEETPGLGGRIGEEDFLKKFEGKSIAPRINIVAMKKAVASNEVDAISGATMSSKALENIINAGAEAFRSNVNIEDENDGS